MTDSILECDRLLAGYAGRAVLPPVTLAMGRGELWSVIGRNGSGKTTFLRTLLGLLPPVGGVLRWHEREQRAAYLPQRTSFDPLYPLTARDVVELGCDRGMGFLPWKRRGAAAEVDRALDLTGSGELAHRPFRTLSEGQKQRVLLARVAASRAHVAVLDEPTSALDTVAEREAYELMQLLRRDGTTVVVVSHALGLARQYTDHVAYLDEAAVVVGTPDTVFEHAAFLARYGTAPEGHRS